MRLNYIGENSWKEFNVDNKEVQPRDILTSVYHESSIIIWGGRLSPEKRSSELYFIKV